jgi:hypothetical protein
MLDGQDEDRADEKRVGSRRRDSAAPTSSSNQNRRERERERNTRVVPDQKKRGGSFH